MTNKLDIARWSYEYSKLKLEFDTYKVRVREAIKNIFADYIADAKDAQEAEDFDCLADDLEMELGLTDKEVKKNAD